MNSKSREHITLKTKDLSIGYSTKNKPIVIASNINIALQKGELVGLIGANGIGKSTLLRTITQMQTELSGKVLINDQDVSTLSQIEIAKAMSVVLTEPIASKNLSVFELVALGRQPYTDWIGHLKDHDLNTINSALNLTNTSIFKDRKCYELSDGQLQNVMIARALAQETDIMILDEPTTHLDLHHKVYVLKLLQKLAKETNKTILFSSHEIELAMQLCHKLIIMTPEGVQMDTPENHIKQNNFDTLFPQELISFDAQTNSFKVKK